MSEAIQPTTSHVVKLVLDTILRTKANHTYNVGKLVTQLNDLQLEPNEVDNIEQSVHEFFEYTVKGYEINVFHNFFD